MKCVICGTRSAVIHIQQVIGKERLDLHLCDSCALERGITTDDDRIEISISSLLNGLMEVSKGKSGGQRICPRCGSTWERIRRRERMGCEDCYTAFAREIRFVLQKMAEKCQHRGKLPPRLRTYKTYLVDVVRLKEGLKEAVRREDYEKAARLRDRIRELEKHPGEG